MAPSSAFQLMFYAALRHGRTPTTKDAQQVIFCFRAATPMRMSSNGGSSLRSRLVPPPPQHAAAGGQRFQNNDNESDETKLHSACSSRNARPRLGVMMILFSSIIFFFVFCWWTAPNSSNNGATTNTTILSLRQEKEESQNKLAFPKNSIPPFIFSSCKTKHTIPSKVYRTMQRVAPNFQYRLFDDDECREWLEKEYNTSVANKYASLKHGAHRGDLFRYAILLKQGGIWIDVDLKPLMEFSKIFHQNKNTLYTCANDVVIFQAVLATPPNHSLMRDLFHHALTSTPRRYEHFLYEIHKQISLQTNHSGPFETAGLYKGINNITNFYLFKEQCTRGKQGLKDCPQGLSKRWNSCCYVYDHKGNKVFESRYEDYPWK